MSSRNNKNKVKKGKTVLKPTQEEIPPQAVAQEIEKIQPAEVSISQQENANQTPEEKREVHTVTEENNDSSAHALEEPSSRQPSIQVNPIEKIEVESLSESVQISQNHTQVEEVKYEKSQPQVSTEKKEEEHPIITNTVEAANQKAFINVEASESDRTETTQFQSQLKPVLLEEVQEINEPKDSTEFVVISSGDFSATAMIIQPENTKIVDLTHNLQAQQSHVEHHSANEVEHREEALIEPSQTENVQHLLVKQNQQNQDLSQNQPSLNEFPAALKSQDPQVEKLNDEPESEVHKQPEVVSQHHDQLEPQVDHQKVHQRELVHEIQPASVQEITDQSHHLNDPHVPQQIQSHHLQSVQPSHPPASSESKTQVIHHRQEPIQEEEVVQSVQSNHQHQQSENIHPRSQSIEEVNQNQNNGSQLIHHQQLLDPQVHEQPQPFAAHHESHHQAQHQEISQNPHHQPSMTNPHTIAEDETVIDMNQPIDEDTFSHNEPKVEQKKQPLFRLVESQEVSMNQSHQYRIEESIEIKQRGEEIKIEIKQSLSFSDLNYSEAGASQEQQNHIESFPSTIEKSHDKVNEELNHHLPQPQPTGQIQHHEPLHSVVQSFQISQPSEIIHVEQQEVPLNVSLPIQILEVSQPVEAIVEMSSSSVENSNPKEIYVSNSASEKLEDNIETVVEVKVEIDHHQAHVARQQEPLPIVVQNLDIVSNINPDVESIKQAQQKIHQYIAQENQEKVLALNPAPIENEARLNQEQQIVEKIENRQEVEQESIQDAEIESEISPTKFQSSKNPKRSILSRIILPSVVGVAAGGAIWLAKKNPIGSIAFGLVASAATYVLSP